MNRHIYKTVNYDRKIDVLTKDDYMYMHDLLETVLEQLQNSDLDNDSEIDRFENFFAKLKQYRGIATRYDKLAQNFLSAIYLASTMIWLN